MEEPDEKEQKETRVWYAVRTFYCKEKFVADFFTQKGLNSFIPMRYEERFIICYFWKRHRVKNKLAKQRVIALCLSFLSVIVIHKVIMRYVIKK